MKNFKTILLTLILSMYLIPSHAQNQSNLEGKKVNMLMPSLLSPDGEWLLYNKYNDKMEPYPDCFFINTKNKNEISLKQNTSFYNHLLKNDFILGQENNTLSIINLSDTTKTQKIPNIVEFDSDNKKNIIFTLNKDGDLKVFQLNKQKNSQIFHVANVEKYFTNPKKTFLIYQEKLSKKLYIISLDNFKSTLLDIPKQEISSVQWGQNQNCILLKNNKNNDLIFIDLITKDFRNIKLPNDTLIIPKITIYANNDLLITFKISTNEKIPESEFITIWSSNSGKNLPIRPGSKNKINAYSMVYIYETKQWINLETPDEKNYIPNTIPDFVIFTTPYKNNQFLRFAPEIKNYIQNIHTKEINILADISGNQVYISPDNTHILYPKENSSHWEVYNPITKKRLLVEKDPTGRQRPFWSTDSKYIIFNKENNIFKLEIATHKLTKLSNFRETADFNFVGKIYNEAHGQELIDLTTPIVYTVNINHKTAIYKIKGDKSVNILPFTTNKLSYFRTETIDLNSNTISWLEENYNLPHTIKINQNNANFTLIKSPLPEEDYKWQRQRTIKFKDSQGVELEGMLYYPKNFVQNKKFPMITIIYDEIWKTPGYRPNEYIPSTYYNQDAYNRTLFNEHDYFVFNPDTYVNDAGPGVTAIDCVESAIYAVLEAESSIDEKKIGLTGGSFGGYKSSLIASHSNLFATIVNQSGPTDLIGDFYYRNNLNFRNIPEYGRVEGGQYKMKQTFAENPKKYLDNSPLIHAHKIKTPMLLIAGLDDHNVDWEMASTFFWALKRYKNTEFMALFYNNVGHAFLTTSEVSKDATKRIIDWFDYYLKDKKEIRWINDRVNPNKNFL